MNQPSKKDKNRRNGNFWNIRMQRQISNLSKQIPLLPETVRGCNNGTIKRKKRKILRKYGETNGREVTQLT